MPLLTKLQTLLDGLSDITGKAVSWLCLLMMLATSLVAILRYGFDFGSIALQESVTYMHAAVFMLGSAWTLKYEGHVRVDVFYRKFSSKNRALVDLLGSLLFLMPLCLFILISSLDFVADSWRISEKSSEPGGLPAVFLLKTLIPVMAVLLLLQGSSLAIKNLLLLIQPDQVDSTEASTVNENQADNGGRL